MSTLNRFVVRRAEFFNAAGQGWAILRITQSGRKQMDRCRAAGSKAIVLRATELIDCQSKLKIRKQKKKDIVICAWLWCIAKGARGIGVFASLGDGSRFSTLFCHLQIHNICLRFLTSSISHGQKYNNIHGICGVIGQQDFVFRMGWRTAGSPTRLLLVLYLKLCVCSMVLFVYLCFLFSFFPCLIILIISILFMC